MKKILVTGADGFIGSHLTELLLEKGYQVRALSQYNSFNYWGWLEDIPANPNLEVVCGDVRDPHFVKHIMKNMDIVFHLAALIAIPYSYHVKLLFVFTGEFFLGILTIGDIQRAIIANISLTEKISVIIDKDKKYASLSDSVDKIKADILALRSECMPVLDIEKKLVNVYFWNDFFGDQAIIDRREKINLPVVIMAGGLGTRLKPLTNVIPKPLIPIGEKTILETILDQFESIGCSKFFMLLLQP